MIRKTIILLFNLLYLASSALSQDFDGSDRFMREQLINRDTSRFTGLDSTRIEFFYLDDIQSRQAFADTTLDDFFQMYDPSRKRWKEYFNLGNTGSAALPILYDKEVKIGTNYGFNIYDIYKMTEDKFRYYDVNRPFLDFYFTPVGGQQNFVIKTDFARNFSDGLTLTMNYDRIKQEGFYQSQDLKQTNFGLGIWYHHPQNKQDLFVHFINSVQSESQNGGVTNRESLFEQFADNRISLPVELDNAETRFQHHTYHIKNFFRLTDSLGNSKGIELITDLKYKKGYYKFSDPSVTNDANYYGDFLLEQRGIRNFLGYSQIHLIQDIKGQLNNGISGQAGIEYRFHRLNWEAEKENRNDLFLKAKADIPLSSSFLLNGVMRLGLGSSTGDLDIIGTNRLELLDGYTLESGIEFYRHQHPLQAQKLFINELEIWRNDFPNPYGTIIKGRITIPFLNAQIDVAQNLENNLLYYDNDRQPQILEDVFSSTVIGGRFDLRFKSLVLESYGVFQVFSNNVFNLPQLYYKYNAHWTIHPFQRVLDLRIGMEGKVTGPYDPIDYYPLLSIFHPGNENENKLLPYADAYVSAKIKTFRFFLRYENIGYVADNRVYFQVGNYPQFDTKIRLGISWYFLD